MKKILVFTYIFCVIFACVACSEPLGGAKGKVIDGLTGKAIAGAEVIARTDTNIESEMRYKIVKAKTGKDGSFQINGIRQKSYSIKIFKPGFTVAGIDIEIPNKSNIVIDKPLTVCSIPKAGPGVYIYTNEYYKAKKIDPELFDPESTIGYRGAAFVVMFYKRESLADIEPINARYLVVYNVESRGNTMMYKLFRNEGEFKSAKIVAGDGESGDYYSISNLYNYVRYGSFELFGSTKETQAMRVGDRVYKYEPKSIYNSYYGSSEIEENRNTRIAIYDISFVENGYYYVGSSPSRQIPESYVFKIVR